MDGGPPARGRSAAQAGEAEATLADIPAGSGRGSRCHLRPSALLQDAAGSDPSPSGSSLASRLTPNGPLGRAKPAFVKDVTPDPDQSLRVFYSLPPPQLGLLCSLMHSKSFTQLGSLPLHPSVVSPLWRRMKRGHEDVWAQRSAERLRRRICLFAPRQRIYSLLLRSPPACGSRPGKAGFTIHLQLSGVGGPGGSRRHISTTRVPPDAAIISP